MQTLLFAHEPARIVAALYVEHDGPYAYIPDVELWDAERDARRYQGTHPVVAHPPCGPWGRLSFLNKHQDAACGPAAVAAARHFGGVVEHPANSKLWAACAMPKPDARPDEWGGRTYAVRQCAWGHLTVKPTWLYVVGVAHEHVLAGVRTGGVARRKITNGPRGNQALARASARECRITPGPFADWLVSLARASRTEPVRNAH